MSQANSTQLPTGTVLLNRYRVLRALGEGGAGTVYEVENTETHARCALKLLRPYGAQSAEWMQRVVQEARSLPRINHPNAVAVLDVDNAPEGPFVVYELVTSHRDLHALLRARGRLSPEEALGVMLPVMGALAVAHSLGAVHRDLKPGHIVVAETPHGLTPKLTDARVEVALLRRADAPTSAAPMLMGNPRYVAPEQLTDRDADARADVWSCGVVLYELLAGAHPFEASSTPETIVKIVSAAPAPLTARVPSLSPQLADAIHRALRPRAERYATMQEFIDAIHRALGPPAASQTASLPSAPEAAPTRATRSGLGATRWIGVISLLVLLAVALGWALTRRA